MKKYKVIIQESAELDLIGIIEYIANDLNEKTIAMNLYRNIVANINSLSTTPGRCAIIDEEPYKTLQTRRLVINNYSAFYFVNDETESVHIIRILYNHRDWQNLIFPQ